MMLAAVDLGYTPQVVLLAYMVLLLGIGFVGYLRGRQTEEDYYLAGRGQGVWATALTIMATMFSSAAMLGIPGLVYRDGVAFMLFALNLPVAGVAIFVLGSRIARIGRKRGYVTPADLVADYYDGSAAVRLLAALVGVLYVIPYIISGVPLQRSIRIFCIYQFAIIFSDKWYSWQRIDSLKVYYTCRNIFTLNITKKGIIIFRQFSVNISDLIIQQNNPRQPSVIIIKFCKIFDSLC